MTLTVDLVIVGMTTAAVAAASDAALHGKRVLVVGESKNPGYRRRLRRALDAAGDDCRKRVSILAGFEVVSVDGIKAVEVILIRQVKTGGLIGINTGAMLVTTVLASGIVGPALRGQVQQTSPGMLQQGGQPPTVWCSMSGAPSPGERKLSGVGVLRPTDIA